MKPYSSNIGDALLGMIFFSRRNFGSLRFVEKFQHFCENMQGLFSAVELELCHILQVYFWYHCYTCSQTYSELLSHCLFLHAYCYLLGSVFKILHQASCSGLLMYFPSVVPHRANTHPHTQKQPNKTFLKKLFFPQHSTV